VISSGDNNIAFALANPNNQLGDPAVVGAAAITSNQQAYVIDAATSLADKIADVQAPSERPRVRSGPVIMRGRQF
jgi:hypothetical protein